MSGHSKWKTIQHKKGAADAKRGKIFSKLAKELMVVAKRGGSDANMNASLRNLIQKAKSVNMPADNIDRAVKKGAGELEGVVFEEVMYEGYAGGGVALIVMVLTDNRNRTAAEVRHVFTKHGSSFAALGSVARGFDRKGQIFVDAATVGEEKLMSLALDAGAEDMQQADGQFEILTDPASFANVMEALEKAGIATLGGEVSMVPQVYVTVKEKAVAASLLRFVGDLEDHDDVQNVYTNMDILDEVLKELKDAD
jgi:YebC/PmpR family DNA-binding regulatory protein